MIKKYVSHPKRKAAFTLDHELWEQLATDDPIVWQKMTIMLLPHQTPPKPASSIRSTQLPRNLSEYLTEFDRVAKLSIVSFEFFYRQTGELSVEEFKQAIEALLNP